MDYLENFKNLQPGQYTGIAMALLIILLIIFFVRLDCNLLLKFYATFLPRKSRLNRKKIWIVGASTGNGEELAYSFAKRDCKLILTSQRESKLEEVKKNCIERSKGRLTTDDILVIAYDITEYSKNDAALKEIVEKFGEIDVLVCNAGRGYFAKIEDDFDSYRKVFELNLFSHIYITKMMVRHWLAVKQRDGAKRLNKQILAVSSLISITEMPFASFYVGSKMAMNAFFHDVAMQYQKLGISVTIASPGPVKSDFFVNTIGNRKIASNFLRKMTTKRCADLIMVALANKVHDAWIANQPTLLAVYFQNSFNPLTIFFYRIMGPKLVERFMFKKDRN